MNVLTIAGNVGRDARINQVNTANGPISVLNFAVAVQKRQKGSDGKPLTLWVDCALWGARADALAAYVVKGTKITVTGEADVETYQSNDGQTLAKMILKVSDLTLQGGGQAVQNQQPQGQAQGQQPAPAYRPPVVPQQQPARQPNPPANPPIDFDDDIPF